jgi:hypothetical protein
MPRRPKITKALTEIEHGSEVDACEAAKELADVNREDVLAALFRILRSAERPSSREAAAYALSWNKGQKAVTALLICASDPDE